VCYFTAPRSGLAWKHSIDVGAGVIDADYHGPVGVILFNHSDTDFTIQAGDRIAQLILQLIITPQVLEVDDLDTTTRGEFTCYTTVSFKTSGQRSKDQ
jgi:dUTP pyrophosphatase